MSKVKNVFLQEILVNTALLGGVWTALQLNPEALLVRQLHTALTTLSDSDSVGQIFTAAEISLVLVPIIGFVGACLLGRVLGFFAFLSMWLAGYLLIQAQMARVVFLFVGWGLGLLAAALYMDNQPRSGAYGRV